MFFWNKNYHFLLTWWHFCRFVCQFDQVSSSRTVISYNLAITTLGAKGLQWSMALQCFDDLCLQRLSPDVISYNALITACNMDEKPFVSDKQVRLYVAN